MVGRCISYWKSPFLGGMLDFRGVSTTIIVGLELLFLKTGMKNHQVID